MERVIKTLAKQVKGGVSTDLRTRRQVSRDASLYELLPDVVIEPRSVDDVEAVVQAVNKYKKDIPKLSITARGAGTDVTGGAIGDSIVLDTTRYLNSIELDKNTLHTQPGAFLRDITPILHEQERELSLAVSSKDFCTIGGVVANNASGSEISSYSSVNQIVRELEVVLADGNAYTIKPLTKRDLMKKIKQNSYEAVLYKRLFDLVETHYDTVRNARPLVTKNAHGYNLWDVWDRDSGIFDLTKLFIGSQGTLGIITDIKVETTPTPKETGTLFASLSSLKHLGAIINTIMKHDPIALEGFDDIPFTMGLKYSKTLRKQLGSKEYLRQQAYWTKKATQFKTKRPNLLLMITFSGETQLEVIDEISKLHDALRKYKLRMDIEIDTKQKDPFWNHHRSTLALVRSQLKSRYAVPYLDDMVVPRSAIPKFLPELRKVVQKYALPVSIHGHYGDGVFHMVPLMDISGPKAEVKLQSALRDLVPILLKYRGSLSGEHNDGMIRGPWLPTTYGQDIYALFRQVKELFDPHYIFNPHKKTDASLEFTRSHHSRDTR